MLLEQQIRQENIACNKRVINYIIWKKKEQVTSKKLTAAFWLQKGEKHRISGIKQHIATKENQSRNILMLFQNLNNRQRKTAKPVVTRRCGFLINFLMFLKCEV